MLSSFAAGLTPRPRESKINTRQDPIPIPLSRTVDIRVRLPPCSSVSSMAVPVMQVREMRMTVRRRIVPMSMCVLLFLGACRVVMPVMRVMAMAMIVLQRFVPMPVRVHFENMEQHARSHERAGNGQAKRERLIEQNDRDEGANERRRRIISPCPRNAQVPQGQNEQHQAGAITDDPERACRHNHSYGWKMIAE